MALRIVSQSLTQKAKSLLHEQTEHLEGYSSFVVENAYKNEIREFFNVVNGMSPAQYGFEQDYAILKLIDTIGA